MTRNPNESLQAKQGALENPIKALRQASRLSLEGLASRVDLSKQYIIRAEQAVYKEPPVGLLNALLNRAPDTFKYKDLSIDEFDLNTACRFYYAYQVEQRKANFDALDPGFFTENPQMRVLHPFVEWRMHSDITARIQISKMYCVHPALIHKFESLPHLVQTVPGELIVALRQSGYSSEVLDSLQSEYDRYKAWMRDKFKTENQPRLLEAPVLHG